MWFASSRKLAQQKKDSHQSEFKNLNFDLIQDAEADHRCLAVGYTTTNKSLTVLTCKLIDVTEYTRWACLSPSPPDACRRKQKPLAVAPNGAMHQIFLDPSTIAVTPYARLRDRTEAEEAILPNEGRRQLSYSIGEILENDASYNSVLQENANDVVRTLAEQVEPLQVNPDDDQDEPDDEPLSNNETDHMTRDSEDDPELPNIAPDDPISLFREYHQVSVRGMFDKMKDAAHRELAELWIAYGVAEPTENGEDTDLACISLAVQHLNLGNLGETGQMVRRPGAGESMSVAFAKKAY